MVLRTHTITMYRYVVVDKSMLLEKKNLVSKKYFIFIYFFYFYINILYLSIKEYKFQKFILI